MNANQTYIKETIERQRAACSGILKEHRERQKTAGDIERTLKAQRAAIENIFSVMGETPPQNEIIPD